MMNFRFGLRSTHNMVGLVPSGVAAFERGLQISPLDFGVSDEAVRTAAKQNLLYQQGRTLPGAIVTHNDGYTRKSNHQVHADGKGYACDATPFINGKFDVNNEEAQYVIAAAICQACHELNIPAVWGGNWYESVLSYGYTVPDLKKAVLRYEIKHPGSDFIDLPHFQFYVPT